MIPLVGCHRASKFCACKQLVGGVVAVGGDDGVGQYGRVAGTVAHVVVSVAVAGVEVSTVCCCPQPVKRVVAVSDNRHLLQLVEGSVGVTIAIGVALPDEEEAPAVPIQVWILLIDLSVSQSS